MTKLKYKFEENFVKDAEKLEDNTYNEKDNYYNYIKYLKFFIIKKLDDEFVKQNIENFELSTIKKIFKYQNLNIDDEIIEIILNMKIYRWFIFEIILRFQRVPEYLLIKYFDKFKDKKNCLYNILNYQDISNEFMCKINELL